MTSYHGIIPAMGENCTNPNKVLACLLAIGNHLNDKTVKAFGIEYLQKAPEVKDTTSKKQSLVTHVVDFLGGKNVPDLYDELGAVTRCTRVDWDQLKWTVEDLENKCRTSWEQLRSLNQQENLRNWSRSCHLTLY